MYSIDFEENNSVLPASCYGNRDKLRPDGPLGPSTDLLPADKMFTVLEREYLWRHSSCNTRHVALKNNIKP